MEKIATLPSTAIYDILVPTFKIFTPLLQAHRAAITATPRLTRSYGQHPRQQVDIYCPSPSSPVIVAQGPPPVLIFLYGGGFTGGDRILPAAAIPDDLVYANLGAFFAARGFITLIPDYRRVNDTRWDRGAIYPSGAEDLACLLAWLESGGLDRAPSPPRADGDRHANRVVAAPRRHAFIFGNSAGGVHLASWLLAPQYRTARRSYLSESAMLRLSGAVLLAVPFHFSKVGASRGDVLKAYYGDTVTENCPFGLLEALEATLSGRMGSRAAELGRQRRLGIPPVLNLEGELEPDDEILCPGRDFVDLWRKIFGPDELEDWVLNGHNHISPPVALMSGDSKGEKWGEDLAAWMRHKMRVENISAKI